MTKKKKKAGKVVPVIIVGLIIVTGFYFFLHSSVFLIKKIAVEGNKMVPSYEIINLAGINLGDNLFDHRASRSEKAIEVIPRIKSAVVSRRLPDKVVIEVEERAPWALLINHNEVLVIDDEGTCLEKTKKMPDSKLPVLSMTGLPARINEWQKLDTGGIKLMKSIIQALPEKLAAQVSEYRYTSEGQVFLYTIDGTEVKLGGMDRIEEKIILWERITAMSGDEAADKSLEYIDLRYEDRPVIQEKS